MTSPDHGLPLRELLWTAHLARWVDAARATVALPDGGDAGRWKRSIAAIIELQAIVCALRDLAAIPAEDRPFARDRAEVLVRRASEAIDRAWSGTPLPDGLLELEADAVVALRASHYAGLTELRWPGPGVLEVPEFDLGPPHGTLAVMPPGSLAMPREPIAWWTEREGLAHPGCVPTAVDAPRQVYRSLDERGRFVADTIAPLEGDLRPGLPMLLPLTLGGDSIGHFLTSTDAWRELQRRALAGRDEIPVHVVAADHAGDGA